MKEIKKFMVSFFEKEAEVYIKFKKPNVNIYNKALKELHSQVVIEMHNRLGLIALKKLKDDDFYERYKRRRPTNPRHLFKISHYRHDNYGEVWICYTSVTNPDIEFPMLTHALLVINTDNEFKVARNYIYSSHESDGVSFSWEATSAGLQDLTFESLGDFIAVERYLEPLDYDDGLDMYNEDA